MSAESETFPNQVEEEGVKRETEGETGIGGGGGETLKKSEVVLLSSISF